MHQCFAGFFPVAIPSGFDTPNIQYEGTTGTSVNGSGMFYSGSRILHEKWNTNLLVSCFSWFQEQSLSLSHIQKDPGSGKKKFIPDPGGKKHRIRNTDRYRYLNLGGTGVPYVLNNCKRLF
jgi:hypothetical protein